MNSNTSHLSVEFDESVPVATSVDITMKFDAYKYLNEQRSLVDGDVPETKLAFSQSMLAAIESGQYTPRSPSEREEAVYLARYALTRPNKLLQGKDLPLYIEAAYNPLISDNEEQGIDAQFNTLLQLLESRKQRKCSIHEALFTDEAWDAQQKNRELEQYRDEEGNIVTPEMNADVVEDASRFITLLTQMRDASMPFEEEVVTPGGVLGIGGIGTFVKTGSDVRRMSKSLIEIDEDGNFVRAYRGDVGGAIVGSLAAGTNEIINLEAQDNLFGLKFVDKQALDLPSDAKQEGNDYTWEDPINGKSRAIYYDAKGKYIKVSEREAAIAKRQRDFTKLLYTDGMRAARKSMAAQLYYGASDDIRNIFADMGASIGNLDEESFWVSNFSERHEYALSKLPEEERERFYMIAQLQRNRVDLDGFWKAAFYNLGVSFRDFGRDTVRGAVDITDSLTTWDEKKLADLAVRRQIRYRVRDLEEPMVFETGGWMTRLGGVIGQSAIDMAFLATTLPLTTAKVAAGASRMTRVLGTASSFGKKVMASTPFMLRGVEQGGKQFVTEMGDDTEAIARGMHERTFSDALIGMATYFLEAIPVGRGLDAVIKQGERTLQHAALATTKRQALGLASRGFAKTLPNTILKEVGEELFQEGVQSLSDYIADGMTTCYAKTGSLDTIDEYLNTEDAVMRVTEAMRDAVGSALLLTGLTTVGGATATSIQINDRVRSFISQKEYTRSANMVASIVRNRREAEGVHSPAYKHVHDSAVAHEIERMKSRLGRELTEDEVNTIDNEVRDDLAVQESSQLYNEYISTPVPLRDKFFADRGFSNESANDVRRYFDIMFKHTRGAYVAATIGSVSRSLVSGLEAMGIKGATAMTNEDGSTDIDLGAGKLRVKFVDTVSSDLTWNESWDETEKKAWVNRALTAINNGVREVPEELRRVADVPWNATAGEILANEKAMEWLKNNAHPDGVYLPTVNGQVNANENGEVNAVIELQTLSLSGSTFIFGHELGHALYDMARRGGLIEQADVDALNKLFVGRDGMFNEEAFADAFGAAFANAFTKQEDAKRKRALPKGLRGRVLQTMRVIADTFVTLANVATAWRKVTVTPDIQSMLHAFILREQEAFGDFAQESAQGTAPSPNPNGERYHIAPLYTGARVGYDKPDTHYVGTGEGNQVYGWGLYASNKYDVAQHYADRYTRTSNGDLVYNGPESLSDTTTPLFRVLTDIENIAQQYSNNNIENAIKTLSSNLSARVQRDMQVAQKYSDDPYFQNELKRTQALIDTLNRLDPQELGWMPRTSPPAIHGQTWWTHRAEGDESHLLEWTEHLSAENKARVLAAIESLGIDERELEQTLGRDWRKQMDYWAGSAAYGTVEDIITNHLSDGREDNAKKSASELLYQFDIDGVKYPANATRGRTDYRDGANYVAFSDEHLRVDHQWQWNGSEYEQKYHMPTQRLDAQMRIADALEGVTRDSLDAGIKRILDEQLVAVKLKPGDDEKIRKHALAFYDTYAQKSIPLSTNAFLYFAPREDTLARHGGDKALAWAEYAIHAVTNDTTSKGGVHSRSFNQKKVDIVNPMIEEIVKEDKVSIADNGNVRFYKNVDNNHSLMVVARPTEVGNYRADLTETTTTYTRQKIPANVMPLDEVSKANRAESGSYFALTDGNTIAQSEMYHIARMDKQYLDAVEAGDMDKAKRLVEDAAREAGYTIRSYHGTNSFGFTIFDPVMSDDKLSLFSAKDLNIAASYQRGKKTVRRIHERRPIYDGKYPKLKRTSFTSEEEFFDELRNLGYNVSLNSDGTRYSIPELNIEDSLTPKQRFENAENSSMLRIIYGNLPNYISSTEVRVFNERVDVVRQFYKITKDATNSGIYEIAVRFDNPLVVNARKHSWAGIPYREKWYDILPDYYKTRSLARLAYKNGFDGVIIKNVFDYGPYAKKEERVAAGDIYIAFNSEQVKSLDPFTYDDEGRLIPLSSRFDFRNADIRYHMPRGGAFRFSETYGGKMVVMAALDEIFRRSPKSVTGEREQEDAELTADEQKYVALAERLTPFKDVVSVYGEEAYYDLVATMVEICSRFDINHPETGILSPKVRAAVPGYVQNIIANRASELGRKAYQAGREYAWELRKEVEREARQAVQAKQAELDAAKKAYDSSLAEQAKLAKQHEAEAVKSAKNAGEAEVIAAREAERSKADKRVAEAKKRYEALQKLERDKFMAQLSAKDFMYAELQLADRIEIERQKAIARRKLSEVMAKYEEANTRRKLREAQKRAFEDARGVTYAELKRDLGVDFKALLSDVAKDKSLSIEQGADRIMDAIDRAWTKYVRDNHEEDYLRSNASGSKAYFQMNERGLGAYRATVSRILKVLAGEMPYGRKREEVMARRKGMGSSLPVINKSLRDSIEDVVRVARAGISNKLAKELIKEVKQVIRNARESIEMPSSLKKPYMKGVKRTLNSLESAINMPLDEMAIAEKISKLEDQLSGKNYDGYDSLTEKEHYVAQHILFIKEYGGLAHMSDLAKVMELSERIIDYVKHDMFPHVKAYNAMEAEVGELKRTYLLGVSEKRGAIPGGWGYLAWAIPSFFDRLRYATNSREARTAIDRMERDFSICARRETDMTRNDTAQIMRMAAVAYGIDSADLVKAGEAQWEKLVTEVRPEWSIDFSETGKPISRSQLIYQYAALTQEDVRSRLQNNYKRYAKDGRDGIDVYIDNLKASLTAGDLRLVELVRQFFRDKQHPLSEVSMSVFGQEVYAPDENYVPLHLDADDGIDNSKYKHFTLFPAFLKSRTSAKRPLDENASMHYVLVKRVTQMNHWMAYVGLYMKTRNFLSDTDVVNGIRQVIGRKNWVGLQNQFDDIFSGMEHITMPTGLGIARTATALIGLGLNIPSAIRQLEGMFAWGMDFGITDSASAVVEGLGVAFGRVTNEEARSTWERAWNSNIIQQRIDTGSLLEMRQAISMLNELVSEGRGKQTGILIKGAKAMQKYEKVAFYLLKHMDAFVCTSFIVGMRPRLVDKWIGMGFSRAKAEENADAELDIAIQRLQQSGRPEYLNNFQRNSFTQWVTMFQGPASMQTGITLMAWRDLRKNLFSGDAQLRKDAVRVLTASYMRTLIFNIIGNFIVAPFYDAGDDEEEETRRKWILTFATALVGPLLGLPLLGAFVNTAVRRVSDYLASDSDTKKLNLWRDISVSVPIVETFARVAKGGVELGSVTKEIIKGDIDTDEVVRTFFFGAPGLLSPLPKHLEELLENMGILEEDDEK